MSGSFLGGVAGATIGFLASGGNPYATQAGFIIGSGVGSSFDSLPDQQGPRLSDLSVQSSEYGKPIPIVYGTIGLAGNIIWASDIIEVRTDTETGGGKGGPSQTTTTYTYFGNFAIAVCDGEADVRRIWAGADKRLIYDADTGAIEGGTLRLYNGTDTQLPDALIEGYLGVGNVPAYRGTAYLVFENFPLANDGNRLPFLTVEVNRIIAGTFESRKPPTSLGNSVTALYSYSANVLAVYDPVNKNVWSCNVVGLSTNPVEVRVNSDVSLNQISSFSVSTSGDSVEIHDIFYTPGSPNKVTISGLKFVGYDFYIVFNADTRALISAGPLTNYYGTAGIQQEVVSPSGVTYQFRKGGVYSINNSSSFSTIGSGTGSGYFIGDALALENHWAAVTWGTTYQTHLRRYDTGALTTFNFGTNYKGHTLYDTDRERLVQIDRLVTRGIVVMDIAAGTATTHTITAPAGADTSPPPAISLSFCAAVYASGYYIFGMQGSAIYGTSLWLVNPDTLVCDFLFTYETNASPPSMMAPLLAPPGSRGSYVISFNETTARRLYFRRSGADLGAVVSELSDRAGLLTTSYNTEALTDIVDGYAIARQTSVRGAIDALRPAYYFDAVESGGVIKYVKRGGAVALVIPDEDLAAHETGQISPDPLATTRQMEVELPRAVYVNYLLAAKEYSTATKYASRLVGSSGDENTLELAMVLSDTKAQEAAEVNLHTAWAQRLTYEFYLPLKYSQLEPTDVVVVKGKSMRIQKITRSPKGVLKIDAVADDANFYVPNVVTTETPSSGKLIATSGPTNLELM